MKPDINKLKDALEKFDAERRKLQQLIYNLEDVPRIKSLIGKYFKYHASYSSYKGTSTWWMYFHVKEYKNDYLITDSIEEDHIGKMEFSVDKEDYPMTYFNPSYIEISKEEFNTAGKQIIEKLKKRFK